MILTTDEELSLNGETAVAVIGTIIRRVECVASNFVLNHSRRERFWMQRRSAKNRHSNARTPADTKIRKLNGRKSPQNRPIRRRAGNVRFARTGWWGTRLEPGTR